MYLYGPDVSNNQGPIDWDTACAATFVDEDGTTQPYVSFGVCKLSEGINFFDQYVVQNINALRRLKRGRRVYHYGLPSENAPEDEAGYVMRCLDRIGGLQEGEAYELDMEDPAFWGDAGEWSNRHLNRLVQLGITRPKIYTYPSYVPERSIDETGLAAFDLWWADYDGDEGPFRGPWTSCELWQMNASTAIPGIGKRIDFNRFRGTIADFMKHGEGTTMSAATNPDPVTGFWIHEAFVPAYDFAAWGRPIGPAAEYTDGYVRQLFERLAMETSGKGQPKPSSLGAALVNMAAKNIPDWPSVHPLLPPDATAVAHPLGQPGAVQ